MSKAKQDLKYFFSPRTIAIIGASGNFDSISGKPLRYLKEHGYKGKVFPINPKYEELGGHKCYKDILDVPDEVDLVLVAVNYKLVLPMLKRCVEKGVKFATVFSSGFAESGEEGKALQQQIKMGVRVEQQALAKHGLNYVIDEYLPRKMGNVRAFLP